MDAAAEGPDELAEAAFAGLAAGRTAISAGYDQAALLRNGDTFLALDAPGSVLIGPDGSRRAVRTAREDLPAGEPGGHILIDHTGRVLAIAN